MIKPQRLACGCLWLTALGLGLFPRGALSQPNPIRVGVYQNHPKIFVNQSGQAAGFWVDLMDEIAAAEDWTVEYIPCEWEVCLTNLEQGRLDLMPDVAHTPERDRRFNFNQELVLASWSVVYRHPRVPVHSLLDLDQKRVAVLKNSVQAEALLEQAEAFDIQPHIVTVDSFDTVFQHIQSGKVDAGITNRFFGTQAEQRYWAKKTNVFILKCAKKTPTIKRVRVELPKVTADVPFSGEMNLHQQTNRATASPLIEFLPFCMIV